MISFLQHGKSKTKKVCLLSCLSFNSKHGSEGTKSVLKQQSLPSLRQTSRFLTPTCNIGSKEMLHLLLFWSKHRSKHRPNRKEAAIVTVPSSTVDSCEYMCPIHSLNSPRVIDNHRCVLSKPTTDLLLWQLWVSYFSLFSS